MRYDSADSYGVAIAAGSSTRTFNTLLTSRPSEVFVNGRTVDNKRVTLGGTIKNVFGRDMFMRRRPLKGTNSLHVPSARSYDSDAFVRHQKRG